MEPVDLGLSILRVVVGGFLAAHGWNKIAGGGGLAGTARWFESIGMRWPHLQARAAAGTEIAAGLALAVGLVTPVAAAAVVALMIVAGITAHRDAGFFVFKRPTEGWEYVAVLAAAAVAIGTTGAGSISLDEALGWHVESWWGLVIAGGLGILGAAVHLGVSWRPVKPSS